MVLDLSGCFFDVRIELQLNFFQPFKFSEKVYNTRKLSELSYHLVQAGMWQELYDSVLCSAKWLLNKTQAFSVKGMCKSRQLYFYNERAISK